MPIKTDSYEKKVNLHFVSNFNIGIYSSQILEPPNYITRAQYSYDNSSRQNKNLK